MVPSSRHSTDTGPFFLSSGTACVWYLYYTRLILIVVISYKVFKCYVAVHRFVLLQYRLNILNIDGDRLYLCLIHCPVCIRANPRSCAKINQNPPSAVSCIFVLWIAIIFCIYFIVFRDFKKLIIVVNSLRESLSAFNDSICLRVLQCWAFK